MQEILEDSDEEGEQAQERAANVDWSAVVVESAAARRARIAQLEAEEAEDKEENPQSNAGSFRRWSSAFSTSASAQRAAQRATRVAELMREAQEDDEAEEREKIARRSNRKWSVAFSSSASAQRAAARSARDAERAELEQQQDEAEEEAEREKRASRSFRKWSVAFSSSASAQRAASRVARQAELWRLQEDENEERKASAPMAMPERRWSSAFTTSASAQRAAMRAARAAELLQLKEEEEEDDTQDAQSTRVVSDRRWSVAFSSSASAQRAMSRLARQFEEAEAQKQEDEAQKQSGSFRRPWSAVKREAQRLKEREDAKWTKPAGYSELSAGGGSYKKSPSPSKRSLSLSRRQSASPAQSSGRSRVDSCAFDAGGFNSNRPNVPTLPVLSAVKRPKHQESFSQSPVSELRRQAKSSLDALDVALQEAKIEAGIKTEEIAHSKRASETDRLTAAGGHSKAVHEESSLQPREAGAANSGASLPRPPPVQVSPRARGSPRTRRQLVSSPRGNGGSGNLPSPRQEAAGGGTLAMQTIVLPDKPPVRFYVEAGKRLRLLSVHGQGKLLLTAHEGYNGSMTVRPCLIWDSAIFTCGAALAAMRAAGLEGGRTYSLACEPLNPEGAVDGDAPPAILVHVSM